MAEAQKRLDRELDTRQSYTRPTSWQRPEVMPHIDPRPGWEHRWVRVSMLGAADPSNISSKFREGYEPVRAEDYPEVAFHAVSEGRFKGNIEVGGLLLCREPAEFKKQRDEYYGNQNRSQMESVDNNFMRDNDPRMRKFSERQSSVQFGSGPK